MTRCRRVKDSLPNRVAKLGPVVSVTQTNRRGFSHWVWTRSVDTDLTLSQYTMFFPNLIHLLRPPTVRDLCKEHKTELMFYHPPSLWFKKGPFSTSCTYHVLKTSYNHCFWVFRRTKWWHKGLTKFEWAMIYR